MLKTRVAVSRSISSGFSFRDGPWDLCFWRVVLPRRL